MVKETYLTKKQHSLYKLSNLCIKKKGTTTLARKYVWPKTHFL